MGPEKDLRTAKGGGSLVLGASRPLTNQLHSNGFEGVCLVGGGHDHSTDPLQERQGGLS
jgi:hypothetical protein